MLVFWYITEIDREAKREAGGQGQFEERLSLDNVEKWGREEFKEERIMQLAA